MRLYGLVICPGPFGPLVIGKVDMMMRCTPAGTSRGSGRIEADTVLMIVVASGWPISNRSSAVFETV